MTTNCVTRRVFLTKKPTGN